MKKFLFASAIALGIVFFMACSKEDTTNATRQEVSAQAATSNATGNGLTAEDRNSAPGYRMRATVIANGTEFELWVNPISAGAPDITGQASKFFSSSVNSCFPFAIQAPLGTPTIVFGQKIKSSNVLGTISLGNSKSSCVGEDCVWVSGNGSTTVLLELIGDNGLISTSTQGQGPSRIFTFNTNPGHPWGYKSFPTTTYTWNALNGYFY